MNGLHLYQKINGPCDAVPSEVGSEGTVNQLLRTVSRGPTYLPLDDHSLKGVIRPQNGNVHLDEVIDLVPSVYDECLAQPLDSAKWTSGPFTELEAAGVLLALPKGGDGPATVIRLQNSSEATPKASQSGKINVGPCKSHKRAHSKVNDALQKEVRKHLQWAAAETGESFGADFESSDNTTSHPPIHKASQLPYRSWASAKKPILQGAEYNKRHCATQNEIQAADRAAMYLRRSLESEAAATAAAAMYKVAFATSGLGSGSRDHCVSTSG